MPDLSIRSFEEYCADHHLSGDQLGPAFADWLANTTGTVIVGGPVGEPPSVIAIPDKETP